jgi:hypothetical protein
MSGVENLPQRIAKQQVQSLSVRQRFLNLYEPMLVTLTKQIILKVGGDRRLPELMNEAVS